jgi:xanthine dehydrogenase accessory factor
MWETLAALDRWQGEGETVAVATLVRACGSALRLPGARLGLTRSGKMVGSVSGGCVDNDVFEHALRVLDTGQPVIVQYRAADQLGLAVGLSCGGSIEVLIEPFAAAEAWGALRRAVREGRPAALAIALAPEPLMGRKRVVFDGRSCAGSIATDLDDDITLALQRLIVEGGTRILSTPWRAGTASVFLEAFPAPQRLLIVGGTHTAIPLCRMAKVLGFRVIVIDARRTYITAQRFPDADELLEARPDEALAAACFDSTSVVILTHDPKFDLPALASALRSGARYIGILGSKKTHERRKAELRGQGFTEADLARVRAPIGLDLGGRSPEEVALAILAEVLAVRYGRDGRALAEHAATIHATT